MKWTLFFAILSSAGALILYSLYAPPKEIEPIASPPTPFTLPNTPLNASYLFDEADTLLQDGVFQDETSSVTAEGEPLYGDVSGDGADDAVVLLRRTLDEGDPMYYVALAIYDNNGFLGMNAVPLNKSTAPQSLELFDELLRVVYQDGEEKEMTRYYGLVGIRFSELPVGEGELVQGTYTRIGDHLSFTPCGSTQSYPFSTDSTSLPALDAMYTERMKDSAVDGVYVVLTGRYTLNEGEDTEDTFHVSSALRVPEQGACSSLPAPLLDEALEDELVEIEEQENHTSPQ